MSLSRVLVAALAVACISSVSAAALVAPQSWTRGADGTTYQHWDDFNMYPTDNTPDVGNINPNGTASLTENTGAAFITGGGVGNIYSPSVASNFTVTVPEADVPGPPHNVTAIAQFKTLGTELDYGSVLINGLAPVDTAELSREALGGFGGSRVETWMLFNIPYANFGDGIPGVEDLTLTFAAASSSMSLDQLSIDTAIRPFGFYPETNPIPEPSSLLLSLAGVALFIGRRLKC